MILPPSSETGRDDGTALTAPNSSQWAAAPAFSSASSLPPPTPRELDSQIWTEDFRLQAGC